MVCKLGVVMHTPAIEWWRQKDREFRHILSSRLAWGTSDKTLSKTTKQNITKKNLRLELEKFDTKVRATGNKLIEGLGF